MRLGILTSHPIQYQAPWFRALAEHVEVEVFFAHQQSAADQGMAGFGVAFEWDVDLLAGYKYQFLNNISQCPSVANFAGCDTPEIARIIHHGNFDAFIVCGWYLKSHRQAMRACREAGIPVLVRGDSQLRTPRSWPKRLAMEVIQRWLLRRFDGFLTVGQRNREYLQHFGVRPEQIFFVPHFVDNEWFAVKAAAAREHRIQLRQQWSVDEKTMVVLFVGKFIAKKRPADIIKALAIIQQSTSSKNQAVAVFVGSGELDHSLRDLAQRANVCVHFAGFKNQSELPACYAAADVLVLPSDGGETWGLVVNEAMACGLPAIVSDAVGCAPDLIDAGQTGFVFPMGDTAALAKRIAQLANLKSGGHDFQPALAAKLQIYSLAMAAKATQSAIEIISRQ